MYFNYSAIKFAFVKCLLLYPAILIKGILSAQDIEQKKKDSGNIITANQRKTVNLASEEDKQVVAQVISNLQFEFNKAVIDTSAYKSLNVLADWLKARDFTLKVSGHADYIGSKDYNLHLSNLRAFAVRDYLVEKGADPTLIQPVGFGKTQPTANNNTNEGRQKNRRVEFTLY